MFAVVSLVAFPVTNRLSALHRTECDQMADTVHEHGDEASIRCGADLAPTSTGPVTTSTLPSQLTANRPEPKRDTITDISADMRMDGPAASSFGGARYASP